jgi:hypothetical protein
MIQPTDEQQRAWMAQWRRVPEREIWPTIPAEQLGRRLTKAEEEAALGHGSDGV